jgi:hypothetical protein
MLPKSKDALAKRREVGKNGDVSVAFNLVALWLIGLYALRRISYGLDGRGLT